MPLPVNPGVDPFEQHMEAPGYPHYVGEKLWTVMPAVFVVKQRVETFKAFPPRQAPGDFNTEEMTKNILKLAADSNL